MYLKELISSFVGLIVGLILVFLCYLEVVPVALSAALIFPLSWILVGVGIGGLAVVFELYKLEKRVVKS